MSEYRLALSLALGTLRSRPTLTVLAFVLLALGTSLMGSLTGTVYLLRGIQAEFLSALTVEIELLDTTEAVRTEISAKCESWPGAEFIQFVSPAATFKEVEREIRKDLSDLFGSNPFPPIIRVRFGEVTLPVLDSLTRAAAEWPGVANVAYPRQLWNRLAEVMETVQGRTGWMAVVLTIIAVFLVGLCMRAQIRYLAPTWELVGLLGMSEKTFGFSLLLQEIITGIAGGLLACFTLFLLTAGLSWLLLHTVGFPLWFYFAVWLSSVALAVLAGAMSPRRLIQ